MKENPLQDRGWIIERVSEPLFQQRGKGEGRDERPGRRGVRNPGDFVASCRQQE